MKKILAVILLGAVSAVSLNAEDLLDELDECMKKQNQSACQKLIDEGVVSVEKCGDVCVHAGLIYSVVENYHQALLYFEKACDLKDEHGCTFLGYMYRDGKGARQDFFKARQYFEKGCELSEGEACNSLGILYVKGQGVKQDRVRAKKYYGKACDLGNQKACDNYRILNEQGIK